MRRRKQTRRSQIVQGFALALLTTSLSACPEVPRPVTANAAPTSSNGVEQPKPPKPQQAFDHKRRATTARVAQATNAPNHTTGQRVDWTGRAMGTRIVLAAYTTEHMGPTAVRRALKSAFDEIVRLEALMTTWREDSEVSQINRYAGKQAVRVSKDTLKVISKSLWISQLSEGTFDITFASMGKLWRFDQNLTTTVPHAAAIETARKKIDYTQVRIDEEKHSVQLAMAGRRINLGGIAKGYAIDRAADILRSAKLPAFFAQAGGDLYVEGRKPSGQPWRVGVRDPRGGAAEFFATVPVQDHALSTAGDYERASIIGNKRYHHIIDPRTGYPATASRSVTIWAKDALTADAIDDAVFILGPEKGLRLVESIEDCGAVIVDANNKVWISNRLQGRVQILRPPTDGI